MARSVESSKPTGLSAFEPRGLDTKRDKMNCIGGKIPHPLSLHGSNSLRGGRRTFNPMCLIDNWFEDRLNPAAKKQLDLYTAADDRPAHGPFGPWASEYTTAYSKGNWKHEKIKIASSTILAIDETGPQDWTSSYRYDYRNRREEEVLARKKCIEGEERRMEEAQIRLAEAAAAREPEWPLTPAMAEQLRGRCCAAPHAQGEREAEMGIESEQTKGQQGEAAVCCGHECGYHRPVLCPRETPSAENELTRKMEEMTLQREHHHETRNRHEAVRFADCCTTPKLE
ncbi:hypothetical protein cyc_01445 [Cyclospora cayetanensis]|uniref:Uncharacterized protein n=1 Tax=Cyclospora cayetanensis TaxID=88456 RepID=A0A1D3D5V0_9EIME|nr:hypothetical protein cyc_01445 [Cyclospora cayetanensis]